MKILVSQITLDIIGYQNTLPSYEHGDSSCTMFRETQIEEYKKNFIDRFGDATLEFVPPRKWKIVDNSNYDNWASRYMHSKLDWCNKFGCGD